MCLRIILLDIKIRNKYSVPTSWWVIRNYMLQVLVYLQALENSASWQSLLTTFSLRITPKSQQNNGMIRHKWKYSFKDKSILLINIFNRIKSRLTIRPMGIPIPRWKLCTKSCIINVSIIHVVKSETKAKNRVLDWWMRLRVQVLLKKLRVSNDVSCKFHNNITLTQIHPSLSTRQWPIRSSISSWTEQLDRGKWVQPRSPICVMHRTGILMYNHRNIWRIWATYQGIVNMVIVTAGVLMWLAAMEI